MLLVKEYSTAQKVQTFVCITQLNFNNRLDWSSICIGCIGLWCPVLPGTRPLVVGRVGAVSSLLECIWGVGRPNQSSGLFVIIISKRHLWSGRVQYLPGRGVPTQGLVSWGGCHLSAVLFKWLVKETSTRNVFFPLKIAS